MATRVNVDRVPRLPTFPARWVLEDPRSRSYFVFWSDPGGKLVRALLMAPSDEELPEHRRVRRIGEKDSDERRQNHDDSRCRSRVDDDRIQDGLPALGAGDRSSELASDRDAQADRGVSEDAGGAQERQARSQRLERPHERQQRHTLSNPNDKMDPIRKRDLPTWAKS